MQDLIAAAATLGLPSESLRPSGRPPVDVRIIGAGMAGLGSAIALRQAGFQPHQLQVFERTEAPAQGGAGIQLSRNGLIALKSLGVNPGSSGVWCSSIHVQRWSGQAPLVEQTLPPEAPRLCMSRARLHQLLLERAHDLRVPINWGQEDAPEAARDWALSQPGRFVVGADGIGSRVRSLCMPPRSPVETAGLALRATLSLPEAKGHNPVRLWMGPGLHAVAYPIESFKEGGQRLSLVICLGADRAARLSGDMSHQDGLRLPDGWWDRVLPGGLWPRGLGAKDSCLQAADWTVWPLLDGARVRAAIDLARGPFALVGDAAHPALPHLAQAASIALEDALVLAHHFRQSPSVMGLRLYGRARRPRVVRLQEEAARKGRIYQLSGPMGIASWARDLVLRSLGSRLMQMDWLQNWTPPPRED